jgi:hypothetical protein
MLVGVVVRQFISGPVTGIGESAEDVSFSEEFRLRVFFSLR